MAASLYAFTDEFREVMIFAIGSTKARARIYRIGITKNIEDITPDFEVFGLTKEKERVLFET